jgi:hypothetical protein
MRNNRMIENYEFRIMQKKAASFYFKNLLFQSSPEEIEEHHK